MAACSCFLFFILLVLLYKFLDRLIRIPKRTSPTTRINNIFITGCDSGFGRIFALRMASKGFRVFASCLTTKGKEELEKSSSLIKSFIMDVRDRASIQKAFSEVKGSLSKGQGLWALVNNAGMMDRKMGPTEWMLREDYLETCSVNLFGLIEVTRVFLPLLKLTQGRIINTSSITGRIGVPGSGPYVVSKHGVEGFSDCLRYEMVTWGISVHVVEPGSFATSVGNVASKTKILQRTWQGLPDDIKQKYGVEFLEHLMASVEEFASKISSTKLDKVVDCYEHATLGYFPRGRYVVGTDARFLFWPLSLAPEWLSKMVLSGGFKKIKPKETGPK